MTRVTSFSDQRTLTCSLIAQRMWSFLTREDRGRHTVHLWETCLKGLCDTGNSWTESLTQFFSCLLALVWVCWKPCFSQRPKDRSSLDCWMNPWRTAILDSCSGKLPRLRADRLNRRENVWLAATEIWVVYVSVVKANLSWHMQQSHRCWVRLSDPHLIDV